MVNMVRKGEINSRRSLGVNNKQTCQDTHHCIQANKKLCSSPQVVVAGKWRNIGGGCRRETPSGGNYGILAFADHLHAQKPL